LASSLLSCNKTTFKKYFHHLPGILDKVKTNFLSLNVCIYFLAFGLCVNILQNLQIPRGHPNAKKDGNNGKFLCKKKNAILNP